MTRDRPDAEPVSFDLAGPLPRGVTLLEASAGTGKTFAIAALVARYVAEGTPLERLLVITFTRMATGKLRERVRERLVVAADVLSIVAAGGSDHRTDDEVIRVLAEGSAEEIRRRAERLALAVADLDAATIETTHGFCLHVLAGLGVAGDVGRDVTFVEDVRDLLDEVVDDLYVQRFWSDGMAPPFARKVARDIGGAVMDNPSAVIFPERSAERTTPAMRGRLARRVCEVMEQRKREAGLITYDDLLTRLAGALVDPVRGPAVAQWLRDRYDVALVDEFQDTDLVQWDIMRQAFGTGQSTLVLIGDPKQAIYAFRGADVFSYLRAAETAAHRATLDTNWRSDQGLLDAYDVLFAGSQLGHAGIRYRQVRAANPSPRLVGVGVGAPLRIRVLDRNDAGLTPQGFARVASARTLVAADVAAQVVTLLESEAAIVLPERPPEAVRPGHMAVLVRTNSQALIVCDALRRVGVPAVTNGSGSVFGTEPARDWLRLLEALERPTARDRAAAVALTTFLGWTAERVATASESEWEDLHWLLHRWGAVLRRWGVAALLEHVSTTRGLAERVLSLTSGERTLTDLRHVGQLLHGVSRAEGLGSTALTAWLGHRIDEGVGDAQDEERSRRLESDDEAVQVLTIHRSKGLEFPVVFCPYLWDFWTPTVEIPIFHDPGNDDARTLNVGGRQEPSFRAHSRLAFTEQRGEDLRLLYVALTRARHQAFVWWAGTSQGRDAPLNRLVFDQDPDGTIPPAGSATPSDADALARFEELADATDGQISVETVAMGIEKRWARPTRPAPTLVAGVFDRTLDERWRRTSYSGITSASHEARVASEPEERAIDDEEIEGPVLVAGEGTAADEALRDVPLPLAGLPGGAPVGTLVHRVLEATDFAAADPVDELRTHLAREMAWRPAELGDPEAWVAGLSAMVATPLGPLAGDMRLCDFGRGDRLDEMGFELPLVGGDTPAGQLSVHDLAQALRTHETPDDVLAAYAPRLAEPSLARTLRGYLNGSLDLVLRLPGHRFVVVDYKTNTLGGGGTGTPNAWHYRHGALSAEMYRAHYPLQALLYSVALHRYLRWRLPGYDPARQFAGILYLFVRGMSSPAFPRVDDHPCGVWGWRPPTGLISGLSDLFDRGRAGDGSRRG